MQKPSIIDKFNKAIQTIDFSLIIVSLFLFVYFIIQLYTILTTIRTDWKETVMWGSMITGFGILSGIAYLNVMFRKIYPSSLFFIIILFISLDILSSVIPLLGYNLILDNHDVENNYHKYVFVVKNIIKIVLISLFAKQIIEVYKNIITKYNIIITKK